MLSKAVKKSRPNVLWCYRDNLELSSHRKKRAKQVKKLMQRGLLDAEKVDAFSLFVETAGIQYCQYRDCERILGNTFGMLVLQDFEAMTPNLLARTIETVEGGGLVVLLLHKLVSLTSLCTMVMDVHERYRTASHSEATGRFNERSLLSLTSCKACIVMDDELNILPVSFHMKSITPVPVKEAKPETAEWENKPFRHYNEMVEMFGYDRATGESVMTASEMRQHLATEIDESASTDAPVSSTKSQSRAKKAKTDEEQTSKLDDSVGILAGAFKEMVDSEKFPIVVEDLWGIINEMELDEDLAADAFVFLLKSPVQVKGLMSTPIGLRKLVLDKMMKNAE